MTSHMTCLISTGSSSSDVVGKGGSGSVGGRKLDPPVSGGSPLSRSKAGGVAEKSSRQQPPAVDLLLDLQVSGCGRGVACELVYGVHCTNQIL